MIVIDRMRRVGAGLAALAGMRVELFGIELREQFDRWLAAVVFALLVAVLGSIGLAFVATFITVAFWDSNPLVALGIFAVLFLGAAAWCARRLSAVVLDAPAPFEATLAEFRKDRDAVAPHPAAADARSPASPVDAAR